MCWMAVKVTNHWEELGKGKGQGVTEENPEQSGGTSGRGALEQKCIW